MNIEEFILIPMPKELDFFNALVRCDMAQGPCSCGAWHKLEDWPPLTRQEIVEEFKRNNGKVKS